MKLSFFLLLSILSSVLLGQFKKTFPTLSYDSIQSLNIKLPYIRYYGNDSSLLVFGSNHTTDFNDDQIKQLPKLISAFKPSIVLYEGDGITTAKSQRSTVETYFEMGLAKYISDSMGIKSMNIEPNTRDKFNFLKENFSTDDILIATLGLQVTALQQTQQNFENLFPIMISDLEKEGLPLSAKQKTLSHFYELYQTKFGTPFSYDTFDARNIQAKYNNTIYNRINRAANMYRDQYIISLCKELIIKKEKVFLLVGGWHAIVCEPSFNMITK